MLSGTWTLTRWINDAAPISGSVEVCRLGKRRWRWAETVYTPLLDGQVIEGAQAYEIEISPAGVIIYFASGANKGTKFQAFPLTRTPSFSSHKCGEDTYDTSLEIFSKHHIKITHRVIGPRKDYLMISVYSMRSDAPVSKV